MGESSRAVVVVYVNHGRVGQFSRGEYSAGIFPSTAVDPVAVNAVQVPGQRKDDRTLSLELAYNSRAAPFKSVAVFDECGQGKKKVVEVWHVRKFRQQRFHEAVFGKMEFIIPFDHAG